MTPASKIANISSEVATGRRIKGREGFIARGSLGSNDRRLAARSRISRRSWNGGLVLGHLHPVRLCPILADLLADSPIAPRGRWDRPVVSSSLRAACPHRRPPPDFPARRRSAPRCSHLLLCRP